MADGIGLTKQLSHWFVLAVSFASTPNSERASLSPRKALQVAKGLGADTVLVLPG